MSERTDSISPQVTDSVVLTRQNYLKRENKSERNFIEGKHFENFKENQNDVSDIEQQHNTIIEEDFEEGSEHEKCNTKVTSNSISSDIESDLDRDELQHESLSDDRRFSQNLTGNINPYSSTFNAEVSRLRLYLEFEQFKHRTWAGASKAPPILNQARRPTRYANDSIQHVNKSTGICNQHSSSSPKSFQSSPEQGLHGQWQGSRSSPNIAFDEDNNTFIPRIKEGLFFCHLCNFSGSTQQNFDVHMTVHFEHICPHCDYKSRTEGRLKRHIKDFHTEDPDGGYGARTMPGRPKMFRCKQCEYYTVDKLDFWSHSRSHIKEDKLLQCPQCPFVTEYKHHLEYHLRNHFGSKPFKCCKCNYACVNKSMLNSHMKSHTNVYQYRCADCTYATKYCHSLKLHMRKYNHNPAAVLNSDGSLPQGIDTNVSGLSLLAKRGPPRGPRDPKKDKIDLGRTSFHPMPLHPIGALSLYQRMISPFWPMLHSQFSGSSPGTLGHEHRFSTHLPGIPIMPQVKSEDIKPPIGKNSSQNPNKCNFCNFTGTDHEVLMSHLIQVHAAENRDLFSMFSLSSESLHMFRSRIKCHRKENVARNSLECFVGVKKEFTDEGAKITTNKELDEVAKETTKMPPDTLFNGKSQADSQFQADSNETYQVSDSLHQMSFKFGSGSIGFKPPTSASISITTADHPLDLTKPKHASSHSSYQAPSALSSYKNDECEKHSCGENSFYSNEVISPPPRKRSRKGKAFKLDTLFMKIQEQKKDNDNDFDEDIDEMYTSDLLPIEADKNSADDQAKYEESINEEDKGSCTIISSKMTDKCETNDQTVTVESSDKIGNLDNDRIDKVNSSPMPYNEHEIKDKTDLTRTKGLKNTSNGNVYNLTSNENKSSSNDISSPPELTTHCHRNSIPAAIQCGADIAWKILNDPKIRNPSDVARNGDNGHKWELSPLDKNFWNDASSCIKATQKLERGGYKCPHCQISFGDCIMYTMHMGYHGYKDPYKCNMCGDTCGDRVEFFLHIACTAHK